MTTLEQTAPDPAPEQEQNKVESTSSAPKFDVIVIGGGSGGYAAARTLVDQGRKVAVVDGSAELGGLCILRGCMPTKALLYAAEVYHLAQHGEFWGLRPNDVSFDWSSVMARKNAMIEDFASYRRGQLTAGKFELYRSKARFIDANTLALESGESLQADRFIVASGSYIPPSPFPELEVVGYVTSDDVLRMETPPKSIAILGGGPVAVELAQFLHRFGVKVTLIQRSSRILKDLDPDASVVIEESLKDEGMCLYTETQLQSFSKVGSQKKVTFLHQGEPVEVVVDEIFNGLGRKPNTEDLGLDTTGIDHRAGGHIRTNQFQQTGAPHIYVVGDCAGPYEIVHIAIQQGETAANHILNGDAVRPMDYRLLTSIVFTDPQAATVGLTEQLAAEHSIECISASYPFNDHGKSMIMNAQRGFVKILADPKTGRILGASATGPVGGELIHEMVVAMAANLTVQEFARIPHYHPTLAEIWTYPAEELADQIQDSAD